MSFADHFSIENIPYGIATDENHHNPTVATRLEDTVIFLNDLATSGLLSDLRSDALSSFSQPTLNTLAALPKYTQSQIRRSIQTLLRNTSLSQLPANTTCHLRLATLHLPIDIGDFTDFSCSHDHVLNASQAVFGRREAPPGFPYFPVGYTGRTSSIVVSGTPVIRPWGQFRDDTQGGKVIFAPSRRLDYELEIAAVIGKGTQRGESVAIAEADEHIFGVVLLNDWSARDIQAFEMNPLGPLCGKSFQTSISPWIVTLEALLPVAAPGPVRDPAIEIASYLRDPAPNPSYALTVQASLLNSGVEAAAEASTICVSQFGSLYWTLRDMVAHQTANGCSLNTGDLLATGTISGETLDSHGCLMEVAGQGGVDVKSADGGVKKQVWLADGDTVSISAVGGKGLGLGECVGMVLPART